VAKVAVGKVVEEKAAEEEEAVAVAVIPSTSHTSARKSHGSSRIWTSYQRWCSA
jgi:hypothetical protein